MFHQITCIRGDDDYDDDNDDNDVDDDDDAFKGCSGVRVAGIMRTRSLVKIKAADPVGVQYIRCHHHI